MFLKCSVSLVMVRLELSDPFVPGKLLCPYLHAFVHTVSPGWMPPLLHYFYICQNPFIRHLFCDASFPPPNPNPTPPPLSSQSHVLVSSLHDIYSVQLFKFFISYRILCFLKDSDLCTSDFSLSLSIHMHIQHLHDALHIVNTQ